MTNMIIRSISKMNTSLTPREIVESLDKYIIGQDDAKRAVAIALRNRWRRMQLLLQQAHEDETDDSDRHSENGGIQLAAEIIPKNILMIGPTGVGKTEIARRLANLAKAPFIKVEATKFTEVGYVGRDVESIIRDLIDIAVKNEREDAMHRMQAVAQEAAEERILDALIPQASTKKNAGFQGEPEEKADTEDKKETATRVLFRRRLRDGELDDKEIELEIGTRAAFEIMGPPGMEEMISQFQNVMENISTRRSKLRRMKVKDALRTLKEEEAAKLIDAEEIKARALNSVEQNGIVFIDEFDKITRRENAMGSDVSREGVQRDLLPLVEGSTVSTKHGMVKTNHVLFIASGAFHTSKPSDLIPEMQGRFPIRVELQPLEAKDFVRILTEPKASLIKQYIALLQTEGFKLSFADDAIKRLAEIAHQVNEQSENIGARRLHTIMEYVLEEISFTAPDKKDQTTKINAAYVNKQLETLLEDEDLTDYIL